MRMLVQTDGFGVILLRPVDVSQPEQGVHAIGIDGERLFEEADRFQSALGLVGIALGLVGGGFLSLLLIKVINKQSFGWTIQMIVPLGAILQAVGLAAAATLIAGYLPARWAAQQPVADGLREE